MNGLISRRTFAKLGATAGGLAAAPALGEVDAGDPSADKLQSEFLLDLVLETQTPSSVGSPGGNRLIVPVSGGTFEGPRLKGSVIGPSGDWILQRPDGSSLLDVRLLLQTDDAQKIYLTWRGIFYTQQGGKPYARITPAFEAGPGKYAWLNDIVLVGVLRPVPKKVAYRLYQIL